MKYYFLFCFFIICYSLFSQDESERRWYENAVIYENILNGDDIDSVSNEEVKKDLIEQSDLLHYCHTKVYSIFKLLVDEYPDSDRYIEYCFKLAWYSENTNEKIENYQKVLDRVPGMSYFKRQSIMGLAFAYLDKKEVEISSAYLSELLSLPTPLFTCGVAKDVYDSKINQLKEGIKIISKD